MITSNREMPSCGTFPEIKLENKILHIQNRNYNVALTFYWVPYLLLLLINGIKNINWDFCWIVIQWLVWWLQNVSIKLVLGFCKLISNIVGIDGTKQPLKKITRFSIVSCSTQRVKILIEPFIVENLQIEGLLGEAVFS